MTFGRLGIIYCVWKNLIIHLFQISQVKLSLLPFSHRYFTIWYLLYISCSKILPNSCCKCSFSLQDNFCTVIFIVIYNLSSDSLHETRDEPPSASSISHQKLLSRERSKSMHELSPDRAVMEAMDYLRHNPDMAAERRKLRSWYGPSQQPHMDFQQYTTHPEDPWVPQSNQYSNYGVRDVYQPRNYSRPSSASNYHHNNSQYGGEPVPQYPGRFEVFQPRGLSSKNARAHSVERSHSGSAMFVVDEPPNRDKIAGGYYTNLVHTPGTYQTATTDQNCFPPLKGILKKTSRYGRASDREHNSGYRAEADHSTDQHGKYNRWLLFSFSSVTHF